MARQGYQTQHLELGLLFEGKYRIVRELGHGGFGMVYLARQEQMDRNVAIKVLKSGLDSRRAVTAKERFMREVRVISKLRHPNTVTIHDFGESDSGGLYMVLEYIDGRSLDDILETEGAQRPERSLHFASQIARSLAEAHRHGVVHRDLKPANIMVTHMEGEGEFVKVLDFGVAGLFKENDRDLTMEASPDGDAEILGTPRYMSPEQVRGEDIDGRADVYCLGLLLYEMLVGEPAVQGDTTMALITQQISPQPLELEALPALTPRLRNLVRRCTAKNIDDRYDSAERLARDLKETLQFIRRDAGADASASADFGGHFVSDYDEQLDDMQGSGGTHQPGGGHSDELGAIRHSTPNPSTPKTPSGQPNLSGAPHRSQDARGGGPSANQPQSRGQQPGGPHAHRPGGDPQAPGGEDLPPAPSDRDSFSPEPDHDPTRVADRQAGDPPGQAQQQAPDDNLLTDTLRVLVMGSLAVSGVYIAFLMVGAMLGVILTGTLRFAGALALALAIPVLTAVGETSRRERMRTVTRRVDRIIRAFIGTAIFGFGTAVLVAFAMPAEIIERLHNNPNWFLNATTTNTQRLSDSEAPNRSRTTFRPREGFVARTNRQFSATFADLVETTTAGLGLYQPPLKVDHSADPNLTGASEPPAPTRPATQAEEARDEQAADQPTADQPPSTRDRNRSALDPPPADDTKEADEKKKAPDRVPADHTGGSDDPGTYQEW